MQFAARLLATREAFYMPLFDSSVPRRLLWSIDAPWPKRRAAAVIKRFAECYPHIKYDFESSITLANAQAFLEAGRMRVRLFGGLIRHRKIGSAGLAVVLAHETGHHQGGPPYLVPYRWLSSEERATTWARTIGIAEVFGPLQGPRVWKQGLMQLSVIAPHDAVESEPACDSVK